MPADTAVLLVVLFFLAAASGWAAARYTGRRRGLPRSRLNPSYFKGIDYLLNEQPDKALDVFVRLLDVDGDTVETHFALGSLFRRRGEVERAIRIHQNIIARPNLPPAQREEALFALGEDYLRAGLFDRAELLFRDLLDTSSQRLAALRSLVSIYEQQKDWAHAIEVRKRLSTAGEAGQPGVIAHYWCEMADEALAKNDAAAAGGYVRRASAAGRRTIRGQLMAAAAAEEAGEHKKAVRLYQAIVEQDGSFIFEVLPALARCFEAAGNPGQLELTLGNMRKRSPSIGDDLAFAAIVHGVSDVPVAAECIRQYVGASDGLAGLLRDLDPGGFDLGDDNVLERLVNALRRLAMRTPHYRCSNCGYAASRLYWQCPGCKAWDTTRPAGKLHAERIFVHATNAA